MLAAVVLLALCGSFVGASQLAATGNNDFGLKVYRQLAAKEGNVLVCPLSASTILALTMMGAEKNTLTQMASALSIQPDKTAVANSYKTLTGALRSEGKVQLDIANKVFAAPDIDVKPQFKSYAVEHFHAEIDNINFAESSKAAQTMNSWVEKKTHDKIKNLIDPQSIDGATRMVLINAIYFNGKWKNSFNLEQYPLKFRLNAKDTVDVPRLYQENDFPYYDDAELGAQILELPYDNEDYSLVLILPHEVEGLAEVEHKLTTFNFDDKLKVTKVRVTVPKFKIESTIHFIPILQKLGMLDAFSGGANFSGIANEPLVISEVIQKAFIEVDEKGTVAAAATAGGIIALSAPILREIPVKFIADRPFLFNLRHRYSNSNLFVGRHSKPKGIVPIYYQY